MSRAGGHLPELFGESWRVAPDGQPPTAPRCSCAEPLVDRDADGFVLCVVCGREPSIRLPAAEPERSDRGNGFNHVPMTPPDDARYADYRFVGFKAPPDLIEDLKELAARQDRSMSGVLRTMIRQHLNEERQAEQPDALLSRGMDHPANEA